jgi:sarcosine oxidase subunit alpha
MNGAPIFSGSQIIRTFGSRGIQAVEVMDSYGNIRLIDCDSVAMSNGWNPAVHLTCHLGGRPLWSEKKNAFVPGTLPVGLSVAGAAQGNFTLSEALDDGFRLGTHAAVEIGFKMSEPSLPGTDQEGTSHAPLWRCIKGKGKRFVDFQHDVTDTDIELANQEGFRSVEHMKRYTTLGMATDQGKTSNIAGLAILAEVSGRSMDEVGTTIFRPPFTPVALGSLAGHHRGREFRPTRYTRQKKRRIGFRQCAKKLLRRANASVFAMYQLSGKSIFEERIRQLFLIAFTLEPSQRCLLAECGTV